MSEPELVAVPPWTDRERLGYEKELLGFYVTGHPLGSVAKDLARLTTVSAHTVEEYAGREVRVGGLLVSMRETRTKKGDAMAFGRIEDLEGAFEVVLFPRIYAAFGNLLREAESSSKDGSRPCPLIIQGTLEEGDTPKVLANDVMKLEDAEERLTSKMRVRVLGPDVTADRMSALRTVLEKHGGDCAFFLHITIPGETETVLSLGDGRGVTASEGLRRDVDSLFGRPVAECTV